MAYGSTAQPAGGAGAPAYPPLPAPERRDGTARRVGVELEFAGLSAEAAAAVVARWGGAEAESRLLSAHAARVEVPGIGRFDIYLDMAASHPAGAEASEFETSLRKTLGDTAQIVVPVEVVCPPIEAARLGTLDALVAALRESGAQGTDASVFYGFGMHLNVETRSLEARDLTPVLRAFVLAEAWLRAEMELDITRRTFTFVDPFPVRFVDRVADDGFGAGRDALIAAYLEDNPTRNRSLDMTPILAEIAPERVAAALGGEKLSPRPTFHYRLPDCAIGTPGWTPAADWRRWVLVERLAEDGAALAALAEGWRAHRERWLSMRSDWVLRTGEILRAHGLGV